jgi:hypothetical protein
MDSVSLKINNWDKYNPRKDIKRPSWFAMDNEILQDDIVWSLSDAEFRAWIHILCTASKSSSDTITVNFSKAKSFSRIDPKVFAHLIGKLEKHNLIQVFADDTNASVRARSQSVRYTTEHNITEHNITPPDPTQSGDAYVTPSLSPFDLLKQWNLSCSSLPKAKALTSGRLKRAKSQIAKYPDPNHWTESLNKWLASKWVVETWRPGFDDWLDESKRIKALEGRYDEKVKHDDLNFERS